MSANMKALFTAGALVGLSLATSGCSSTIDSLSKDPAIVSVHQQITAPGWTVVTDYSRSGTTNGLGAAGSSGVSVGKTTESSTTSAATSTNP